MGEDAHAMLYILHVSPWINLLLVLLGWSICCRFLLTWHVATACPARVRAQAQAGGRAQLDTTLEEVTPFFDMDKDLAEAKAAAATAAAHAPPAAATAAGTSDGMGEITSAAPEAEAEAAVAAAAQAIAEMYAPVMAMCNKGKRKAAKLKEQCSQLQQVAAGGQGTGEGAAGEPGSPTAAVLSPKSPSAVTKRQVQQAQKLLLEVRGSGVTNLCEVAAGQVMLLLQLAQSLTAVAMRGTELGDGIDWPKAAAAAAGLLRQQADMMLADLREMAVEFISVAAAAMEVFGQLRVQLQANALGVFAADRPGNDAGLEAETGLGAEEAAAEMGTRRRAFADWEEKQARLQQDVANALQSARAAGLQSVTDGFRSLLYVVLLSSLHSQGLQEVMEGKEGSLLEDDSVLVPPL